MLQILMRVNTTAIISDGKFSHLKDTLNYLKSIDKDYPDSGGWRIMTDVILISCAFILGGIFGMILSNFMWS